MDEQTDGGSPPVNPIVPEPWTIQRAAAEFDLYFATKWYSAFPASIHIAQLRETMAEIAIRCSSPDPEAASVARQIMDAEGLVHGQTADQRIAARIDERAQAQLRGARLSVVRDQMLKMFSTATDDQAEALLSQGRAALDAV